MYVFALTDSLPLTADVLYGWSLISIDVTTHHTELVVIYRSSVKSYSYTLKYAKITPLSLKMSAT